MQELVNVKAAGTYSDHSALKATNIRNLQNSALSVPSVAN
jgi:hypothetical protein